MIEENLAKVHDVISQAAKKADRSEKEITLIAVSKTKPLSDMIECCRLGEHVFGENYVQEIVQKWEQLEEEFPELKPDIHFHMIGHLQRNKVKYIIDKVDMIHSVDSLRLALAIEAEAAKKERTMEILLEVNAAQEESKWGFTLEEVEDVLLQIEADCPHLKVRGLMTSAPYTEDPESNRLYFRSLKEKLVQLAKSRPECNQLSMGMTGDYGVAIEEGATLVRVGTGVFGARDYSK